MGSLQRIGLLVSALLMANTSIMANDTAVELSIGGLRFGRSANVAMLAERLQVSVERVRVRYEFFNKGTAPVSLSVAFPLPDIDLSTGENIAIPMDAANFVDFETRVDGKPISLHVDQRAFVGKDDVTALLKELNLPLLPLSQRRLLIQNLPGSARQKLVEQGLLVQMGADERNRPLFEPGWLVRSTVLREQQFPANRPVIVEHSYRPSIGLSSDTILRKALRLDKAMSKEVEQYRKQYCITDSFLAELDRIAGDAQPNQAMVQERRLNYVLKTGANWAGPIKDFKLVIEKAGKDGLVSFCSGSLKQTDSSKLEFHSTDFTPDTDLKILFVGRF